MKNSSITKTASMILISIIAIFTIVSPYIFDWNITHIYNPRWPPHAKFHNAQTMMLGTLLGIWALLFLWFIAVSRKHAFWIGLIFADLYWITQMGAFLFPGTALVDPEFITNGSSGGQLYVDMVVLIITAISIILFYWPSSTDQQKV